jgi:hypothetical protein
MVSGLTTSLACHPEHLSGARRTGQVVSDPPASPRGKTARRGLPDDAGFARLRRRLRRGLACSSRESSASGGGARVIRTQVANQLGGQVTQTPVANQCLRRLDPLRAVLLSSLIARLKVGPIRPARSGGSRRLKLGGGCSSVRRTRSSANPFRSGDLRIARHPSEGKPRAAGFRPRQP